jgi:hypothetical protein
MHLPDFGWESIIVTVHHRYYEELLDWNLTKLLPSNLRIETVGALPTKPFRLVGDMGIRGFFPLYRRIRQLIRKEKIDFLYIPIPSNYAALLGRLIHSRTGIPYGIDYIDPWVHSWPGTEIKGSKAWWSMKLSEWLEPYAVGKAALITGVAPGYYEAVLDRNPHLLLTCTTAAMPYGGEKNDHMGIEALAIEPYLFQKGKKQDFVYAGAMLPKAFTPLRMLFEAIQAEPHLYENCRFHFIGTGKSPNDPQGFNIRPIAEEFGLWQKIIFEYPKRIPYLDVLVHLKAADAAFVLGSTEPHYTPSKVYQAVLSGKPVLAILHEASTACDIIRSTNAGLVISFAGEQDTLRIKDRFSIAFRDFQQFLTNFTPSQVDYTRFDNYSAQSVTKILADNLDKAVITNSHPQQLRHG